MAGQALNTQPQANHATCLQIVSSAHQQVHAQSQGQQVHVVKGQGGTNRRLRKQPITGKFCRIVQAGECKERAP